jgi:hypothetical protein
MRERGDYFAACALYAAWFEHWSTATLAVLSKRKSLDPAVYQMLVEDTSLRVKYVGILPLAGLPAIAPVHVQTVLLIASIAAGIPEDEAPVMGRDAPVELEARWHVLLDRAEEAVAYLMEYRQQHAPSIPKQLTKPAAHPAPK